MIASRLKSENGNALWFILVAIVLLGALTVLLTRGGSSVDQTGDVEQARIKASQIMRWTRGLEAAIDQMKMRGVSENQISFENSTTTTNYANAACSINQCRVFAGSDGGGQTYIAPPSGANDGSEWIFTSGNNVGAAAYPVGTTAARSGNDLIVLLPNANEAMCLQINRDLNVGTGGTLPEDTAIDITPFTGAYANALVTIDGDGSALELNGKPGGCFTDTKGTAPIADDIIYFYYVLLAR
ncbi:MAG: hypothetical protein WBK77_07080 [Alphaproteobacteria bacterium]